MPALPTTVALRTTDGVTHTITCDEQTTVLDAAASDGLVLPSLCGQGACGVCFATVTSGQIEHADYNPQAMGPMAGEGAALLCRTYPRSALTVDLPYDSSRIVQEAPVVRSARIAELESVSRDVVRLRLTVESDEFGSAAEFDPGQFMQLTVPGTQVQRAYSLANCGNWDGELEFFIRVLASGAFSDYMRQRAAVGDVLTTRGPQGAFGLVENGLRPRWFVGGGTGVAPLLSMLRRMAEWGEMQPTRLYLGVNTEADVFAREEIAALATLLPDFTATTCVWRPAAELPQADDAGALMAGTPADAVVADLGQMPEPPDIYACGPPAMVQAVEYALAEAGVDPERVVTERFTEN